MSLIQHPIWQGALVGHVQASSSPDIRERQSMTAVVASQPAIFNQDRRTFGSEGGMAIIDQLEKMQIDLAELRSQREDDRRSLDHHRVLLDQLAPVRLQIASVRRPVLAKLAHASTENWPSNPLVTQSRNVLAHGGQLKTDIATIHSEPDPAERQLLRKGFEQGYGVPLSLEKEFLKYRAILNLMNILCNLKTLDGMVRKHKDRMETQNLLDQWKAWVAQGSRLDTYPFTTDKQSILLYNNLIKNYGNTIPME